MDLSTIYENPVPKSIIKKAEKRFSTYAEKFNFDKSVYPALSAYNFESGYEDFGIKTILDSCTADSTGEALTASKTVMISTIRMGFGHCRMAIALASAAKALGYTPYWFDMLSFPDTAATKTIKYLENLYNTGSRISQISHFFDTTVWDYITSSAAQRLTQIVSERSLSQLFAPLYTEVPKDIPFMATHPWAGHAAVIAGVQKVVTIVPDNYPLAFHVVPGSVHAVQSPSAYMGYRTFLNMDKTMNITHCLRKEDLFECGHYVDHEIAANVETDCAQRLRRLETSETRRFLLTMGGAGAQAARFADIICTHRAAVESGRTAFFVNMGDHNGRWQTLRTVFDKEHIPYEMHTDYGETRAFIEKSRNSPVNGIHVFLHNSFYAAVYATNLLMRISDVMITKPSELSFYPVPKLFIQRVGRHEAWGAIRGSEIGDGTIETANPTGMHRTLRLLMEENDLLELYCNHIIQNKRNGMYDGAYNAVKKVVSLKQK